MSVFDDISNTTSKGIESAGRGFGYATESVGRGFSYATEGLPWWAKGLIIAGAVGGGLYIVYYVSKNIVSSFTGTNCNQPGSPCYDALQPYAKTYDICAKEYAYYLDLYLKQDSANGTGFTSAQLDHLNYLYNCMNDASKHIADTAKQYDNNPFVIVAYFAGITMLTVGTLYGLSKFINSLRTKPTNGSTFGSIIRNALIRKKVSTGEITPDQAAGLKNQSEELNSLDLRTNDIYYNDLAEEEIISEEMAEATRIEMDEDMVEDDIETRDVLSSPFE
jgi:hypothetical protein